MLTWSGLVMFARPADLMRYTPYALHFP
jgi:hypothetical protein